MPISSLGKLDVTSVTRSASPWAEAPASIYVITHDDIVRSGTLTLSGILRLAPNLQIMRGGKNGAIIAARGLSGEDVIAQNFSNKLLVLIDGRTVYSPLFSGVYWDMQDVLPEDVERIEVISGPGATLWGSNAVNGVINIITRDAGASQGLYGTAVGGNRTYDAGLRYGGQAGETMNYRVFVKRHENFETAEGRNDGSRRTQAGFRVDWTPSARDTLMLQGDGYYASQSRGAAPGQDSYGYDLLGRWRRDMADGSSVQLQAYYDHVTRGDTDNGGGFDLDTFDVEGQHNFSLGSSHAITWGGGVRFSRYKVENIPGIAFLPSRRTLYVANIFAQDSVTLTPTLTATVGVKLEERTYADLTVLPSARLSWKPKASILLWGAVSRAVRAATPYDRDLVETIGPIVFLDARVSSFRSEKLTAFELGTRLMPASRLSLSISGFYNLYDDLRTVEPTIPTLIPLYWGNEIKGESYGFDAWADIRLADWWRLKPGYSLLIQKFRFTEEAFPLLGTTQVGNDPRHRATLRSSIDVGRDINLDADLRFVSALPQPFTPSYVEMGARIGWQFDQRAELSVSGFNLLHDRHWEVPEAPGNNSVGRSVFIALKWTI